VTGNRDSAISQAFKVTHPIGHFFAECREVSLCERCDSFGRER